MRKKIIKEDFSNIIYCKEKSMEKDNKKEYEKPLLTVHENLNEVTKSTVSNGPPA